MSFRPSGYPVWAAGATNIVEPTDAKKSIGWAISEQPPSSYFNWIQNVQDRAVDYLLWRAGLDKIVTDDFIYPSGLSPSHLASKWLPVLTDAADLTLPDSNSALGIGTVGQQRVASGANNLITRVLVGPRDFRMEVIGGGPGVLGISGYRAMGVMDYAMFIATSATGVWGLHFVPSGGTPTSIPFSGLTGTSATGLYRFTLERRGATMLASVGDQTALTLPGVPFGPSGQYLDFGARTLMRNNFVAQTIDKLELEVGRNP